MNAHTTNSQPVATHPESGSSLVEVIVAILIMGTITAGLLAMAGISLTTSENQGHLAARTAEYAQDKMEQLLVLSFGFSGIPAPPPNTQPAIAQAPPCLDNVGNPIASSACIVFNSRGVPVDVMNAPTAVNALYVGDGATVFGVTVSTGGMIQLWRSNLGNGSWVLN